MTKRKPKEKFCKWHFYATKIGDHICLHKDKYGNYGNANLACIKDIQKNKVFMCPYAKDEISYFNSLSKIKHRNKKNLIDFCEEFPDELS